MHKPRFRWSDISVRQKLYIPVVIQALIVLLVSAVLITGFRLVESAGADARQSSNLLSQLFRLGSEIETFIAGDVEWPSIAGDVADVREQLQGAGNQDLSSQLAALSLALETYAESRAAHRAIVDDVRELTTKSRNLSNAYIVKVSERLADEVKRVDVSTIERAVIAGALKNSVNNFAIESMFLSLARGDRTPAQAQALLEETIANTRQDIILLEGTPFVKKAEAGLVLNLKLNDMLGQFLNALDRSHEARAEAVRLHTRLMQSVQAISTESLLGTLGQLSNGVWILLAVFIATVGISLLSSVLVSISVTRPLAELRRYIDQLAASGGDLSFRLRIDRKDELGMLARGVNQFLQTLESIFSEVTRSGHGMAEASEEMAAVTQRCSQEMKEQQSRTGGVISAAAGIEAATGEAKARTESAAQAVERSESRVAEVASSIHSTIKVINVASIELENATSVINKLNSDSQNIGGILDVIRTVAEQTNLLALNAAIEAARAGDQGRGFAVVADEVRLLAQRTQSSVSEVDTLISNLQNASALATCVVQESAQNIASTFESGKQAGEGVETIAQCISEIAALNAEIAEMMESQLEKAQNINRVVSDIGAIADASSITISNVSQSAGAQVDRAGRLVELMARFSR